jgi:hypothetical protein
MKNRAYSMAVLQAEVAKCELVCANCHHIRTWRRREERLKPPSTPVPPTGSGSPPPSP